MIVKLVVIVMKGMKMFNKLISKIKNKIKELFALELDEKIFYRYKYKFKTYDGKIEEVITNKYYVWNKDQFIKLELLYKNNCIKANDKYYSNIVCVEEVEIYDKMIIFYDDDLDIISEIGRCASKEKIEKYNEEIFRKYGGVK